MEIWQKVIGFLIFMNIYRSSFGKNVLINYTLTHKLAATDSPPMAVKKLHVKSKEFWDTRFCFRSDCCGGLGCTVLNVHFIFVYNVMEFLTNGHGKVIDSHFEISVGTLSKSDVYTDQILTYKDSLCAVRVTMIVI